MKIFKAILFFICITVNAQDFASNDISAEKKCYQTLKGEVRDRVTNNLLPNTIVSLEDAGGNPVTSQMVQKDAVFSFKVTCDTGYRLKAMKKSYTLEAKNFKTTSKLGAELKTKILLDKGSISFIKKSKSVDSRLAKSKENKVANVSTTDIKPINKRTNAVAEEKQETIITTKEPNKEVATIESNSVVVAEKKSSVKEEVITQDRIEEKTVVTVKKPEQHKEAKKNTVVTINTTEEVAVKEVTKKIALPNKQNSKVAIAEVKTKDAIAKNNNKELVLKPIIFDYESSYLNKEAKKDLLHVISIMKKNPSLVVECASFTDAKGSEKYNQWMSDRRAKRTVDYIVSKGISPSRITGKGYGKTQLINPCIENTDCTDEERSVNRRTEFVVIKQ